MKYSFLILVSTLLLGACSLSCTPNGQDPGGKDPSEEPAQEMTDLVANLPVATSFEGLSFSSDKARYAPGDVVTFRATTDRNDVGVRYWHLGDVVGQEVVQSTKSWTWTPPTTDFQGYYAELVAKDSEGNLRSLGTCAVDVSSVWTKFPRYGYLSRFGADAPAAKRMQVMADLNRHHINGLQYYEWAYDHHHPLAGTPENPMEEWDKYMLPETCRLDVIRDYIRSGHLYNMASMFYNLNNGVFEWYAKDGCSNTWLTFKDKSRLVIDMHDLNCPPFRSDLLLVDPNIDAWNEYLAKQTDDVYKVFDFDGFHIDQLGNRGNIYDYNGNPVDLTTGYEKIIKTMKKAQPDKFLAFNAVSGFGQEHIAAAPVDFLYNEVWEYNFGDIKATLDRNRTIDPSRNTVIAAYIHDKNDGYFNTPAVLLLDATIFALGASHIELGEKLICHIYWPSCKMEMKPELEEALVEYYDFLTGYENLLRDGGKESKLNVTSPDIPITYWEPSAGKVNVYGKQVGGRTVAHLINFKDASHMKWRDENRNQTEPKEIKGFRITVPTVKSVSKVWVASPDYEGGAPQEVHYTVSDDKTKVTVTVPYLKYWTMVVVE